MKNRSNPESEFASVREPIIRQLLPLGLSNIEIGLALGRYQLTIQNDIKFMGGRDTVAPNRPSTKVDIYRACFQAWMGDRAQLSDISVKAIERRLDMAEIRAFAHGLVSSMLTLTTPIYPKEFEPFFNILGDDRLPMGAPTSGDKLVNELIKDVRNNMRAVPASAQEVRLALMKIQALDPKRLEILTPFPEYMLEVCQQALVELEREHSPRETHVLKLTVGIDCDKQDLSVIGREMGLARGRIRMIDLNARCHFRKLVRDLLKGRQSGFESLEMLIRDRDKLQEMYDALDAANKALTYQLREIATLVGSREDDNLLEAVCRSSKCVPSQHIFRRVDKLELSVRAANCLNNAAIEYVWQICERTEADLLKTKNFGRKSLNEIKEILAELDPLLQLGMNYDSVERETFPGLKRWDERGHYYTE